MSENTTKPFGFVFPDFSAAENVDFGPEHADYRRIPWPDCEDDDQYAIPVKLPSWLMRFLVHNLPLSSLETRQVRTLEQEIKKQQVDAQRRIQRLRQELKEAVGDEKRLSNQDFACSIALSPFRRLHNDILYQIIQHLPVYLSPSHGRDLILGSDNPPQIHVPTILSRVSTQWHNCVYGLPNLWQHICVSQQQNSKVPGRLLHLHGRLSSSLPLVVEIDEGSGKLGPGQSQLLESILFDWEHHRRLRKVKIRSRRRKSLVQNLIALARQKTPHPNLETFVFDFVGFNTDTHISLREYIATLLDSYPKVQRLWLEGFVPRDMARRLPSDMDSLRSWSNLTNLFGDVDISFSAQKMYLSTLLKLCPRLEVVCLSIAVEKHVTVPSTEVVVHQHLKVLGVMLDFIDSNFCPIFATCRFPKVTAFQLKCTYGAQFPRINFPWGESVFPSLCNLVVLGMWSMEDTYYPHSFFPFIVLFSSVTNLTIYSSDPCDLEHLQCIGQPFSPSNSDGDSTDGQELYDPFPLPQLRRINLRFFIQSDYQVRVWKREQEEKYSEWIKGIQGTRSSSSMVVDYIDCQDVLMTGYGEESRRDMQRYFRTLKKIFKEDVVDIDVRTEQAPWSFPPELLREHFIQYF